MTNGKSQMANGTSGGVTLADVERLLPRKFFVMRGHIMRAFGLTRAEVDALIPKVFTPVPLPEAHFKRHRFYRSQVVAIARRWERGDHTISEENQSANVSK